MALSLTTAESLLNKIRSITPLHYLLAHIEPTVFCKLKELPFPIALNPLRNTREFFARSYNVELEVQESLAGLLGDRPIDHFIDIGANIGFYSWWMRSRSPATVCHMFEPDPRNVALIRRTMRSIDDSKLVLNPVVVSDHNGSTDFYPDIITGKTGSNSPGYDGKTYAENFFRQRRIIRQVPCVTLRNSQINERLKRV